MLECCFPSPLCLLPRPCHYTLWHLGFLDSSPFWDCAFLLLPPFSGEVPFIFSGFVPPPPFFSLKSMFSAIERFQGPRRTLYSILPETSCSCMWNNSFTHSERFSIDISLKNAPSVSPHTLYRFGTLLLFPQSLCFGIVHVHCSSIGYDLWSCHGNSVSFITL